MDDHKINSIVGILEDSDDHRLKTIKGILEDDDKKEAFIRGFKKEAQALGATIGGLAGYGAGRAAEPHVARKVFGDRYQEGAYEWFNENPGRAGKKAREFVENVKDFVGPRFANNTAKYIKNDVKRMSLIRQLRKAGALGGAVLGGTAQYGAQKMMEPEPSIAQKALKKVKNMPPRAKALSAAGALLGGGYGINSALSDGGGQKKDNRNQKGNVDEK